MDLTSRLLRGRATFCLPGADLILTHSKERLHLEQIIRQADHLIQTEFFDTIFLHEHFSIFRRELRDLHFELALQSDRRSFKFSFWCRLPFTHIENDQNWLASEKPKAGKDFTFLGG